MGLRLSGLPGRWFVAPAAPVQETLLRDGFTDAGRRPGHRRLRRDRVHRPGRHGRRRRTGGRRLLRRRSVRRGRADAADGRDLRGALQRFTIPALDYGGSPLGIDARLVVDLGVTPQISTGVLHASSGAGQIGAGVAHQPLAPFAEALTALAEHLDDG